MSSSPSSNGRSKVLDSPSDGAPTTPRSGVFRRPSHRCIAVLPGHVGSVSCLTLCGEFVLSASRGNDIIVWRQPDLRQFTRFGCGEGSVKAIVAVGNRVFTAHQDSRVRVWKVSRGSDYVFRLVATLPTARDYVGRFMKQRNYMETRRNHFKLWIEHADTISCLAVHKGMVYSGSWDKTLKVWRISDLKCLESIKAHADSINSLAVDERGVIYSASADGKIRLWENKNEKAKPPAPSSSHRLRGEVGGHKDMSWNAVVITKGGFVYGGGSDGRVIGWRMQDMGVVCNVRAHKMAVLCLCSVAGLVCCGSADKSISIWKMAAAVVVGGGGGLERVSVVRGHEGPVKCLQGLGGCVGGGFLLYSGGLDKSLRVWWLPKDYSDQWEEEEEAEEAEKRNKRSLNNFHVKKKH